MNRQVLGQKYSFPRIVGLSTFSLQVEPKLCGGSDIRWKSTSSAAPESELTQQQDQDCKVDGRRLAGRERKGGMLGETAKDKNGFKGGGAMTALFPPNGGIDCKLQWKAGQAKLQPKEGKY